MGLFGWLNQQKRIADLERVVTSVASRMDAKDLDWEAMQARCKRYLQNAADRERRLRPDVDSVEGEVPQAANGGGGVIATTHGLLTDRQKIVQQQILRRRAGG
jgi:hypothetical protein